MKKHFPFVRKSLVFLWLAAASACAYKGVVWQKYSPEVLDAARKSGRPVVLDFYADWCGPCLKMKHETFSAPEVIQALSGFEKIQVDATYNKPPIYAVQEKFRILGLPTLVFFDAKGNEVGRLRGYNSKDQLLAFLGQNHARFFGTPS